MFFIKNVFCITAIIITWWWRINKRSSGLNKPTCLLVYNEWKIRDDEGNSICIYSLIFPATLLIVVNKYRTVNAILYILVYYITERVVFYMSMLFDSYLGMCGAVAVVWVGTVCLVKKSLVSRILALTAEVSQYLLTPAHYNHVTGKICNSDSEFIVLWHICWKPRHIARQWRDKHVSVTAVTSCNNGRAMEMVFSTRSEARRSVVLQ
jgi:hypothetical protein